MNSMARISIGKGSSGRLMTNDSSEPSVFSLRRNFWSADKQYSVNINRGKNQTINETTRKAKCNMTFLFDPDGRFSDWMRLIVSSAFLYNFWVILYRYSFNEINSQNWHIWFLLDYFADFIYFLDIAFSFRTGFLEEGVLQTDPTRLMHHYMNTTRFYVDLLCLMPLDILYLSIDYHSILRIFRLVKIYKFLDYLERKERHVNYPNVFRTFKMLHYLFAIIHCNACFSYYISDKLSENFVMFTRKTNSSSINQSGQLNKYLQVFYYTTKIMTMIGDMPRPITDADYLFGIFQLLLALLIFAIIMGNVTYIVSNLGHACKDFQSKFAAVKSYMSIRRVPKRLQTRVIRWFDFLWSHNKSSDEIQVLNMLPCKLRAEISIHVHLDTLKRVEIFQNTEAGFLNELVLKLKPILYSPGDFICRKGEVGKEMYIVNGGKLQVISDDGKIVLATLKAGSYFGEISILNMGALGNRRTASVKSVGYSDLFCLSKEDLWEVLKEYPAVRVKLESIAVKRLEKHKKPLSEIVNLTRSKSLPSVNLQALNVNHQIKRHTLPANRSRISNLYSPKKIPPKIIVKGSSNRLSSLNSTFSTCKPVIETVKENENTSEAEDEVKFVSISNNVQNKRPTDPSVSDENLIDEIERLKKYMKYLENENESLCQRLEKQSFTNFYDSEINKLIVNQCDNSEEFQV